MGLKLSGTTTLENGISFADAYINIQSWAFNKFNDKLNINTVLYYNKAARDAGNKPIQEKQGFHSFNTNVDELGANYIYALCYSKLKSQSYPGSTDL